MESDAESEVSIDGCTSIWSDSTQENPEKQTPELSPSHLNIEQQLDQLTQEQGDLKTKMNMLNHRGNTVLHECVYS